MRAMDTVDLPRYGQRTLSFRAMLVRAELRHQWYLIAAAKEMLAGAELHGEKSGPCHFPAELYQAAKTADRACTRARKLVREYEELLRLSADENALRETYRENLDKCDLGFQGEPPKWLRKGLGAIRELEAFEPFRELAVEILSPHADSSREGSPTPRRVGTELPPQTARQGGDERIRARRAVLLKDYHARLASHLLCGYHPWYQRILKWAVERDHKVLVLDKGRGFSLLPKVMRPAIPERILFVIVASEAARRSAWLARREAGSSPGDYPNGSRGAAVLNLVDAESRDDGRLAGRPSGFVDATIDLSKLDERLAEAAPEHAVRDLVAFAPVPAWVPEKIPNPPGHLKLVPISFEEADQARMLEALADALGVLAEWHRSVS